MNGIDISMYQENVNYGALKASGVTAAYVKATQGTDYRDPVYITHIEGFKSVGTPFGPYHFMSEKTSPTQQAKDFWETIKDTGFNLIPMLDIETNEMKRSGTEVTDRVIEFLETFKSLAGIDCIIYTGGFFGRDILDSRVKHYKAWIAHYGVATPMETGFENIVGHQYTDTGRLDGYVGNLDLDNFTEGIYISSTPVESVPVVLEDNSAASFLGSAYLIKLVQLILNCFGYGLSTDGVCGPLTAAAIGSFQTNNGLDVDYKFGPACLNTAYELIKDTTCGIDYTTPEHTKVIQHILGITVDGVFWYGTAASVRSFQSDKWLTPDGVVGPNTWKKLLIG